MTHDYLIIGAGPAGLQLAALLERDGRDYVVLEAGPAPGTFFATYPRHRQLISINKVWTGSDDPEFNLRVGLELAAHRRSGAAVQELQPALLPGRRRPGALPRRLRRGACGSATTPGSPGSRATTTCSPSRPASDAWPARRVVVATGVSQLYVPPIEGVELAERYDTVSVDPEDFVNQRVLIIGKGNSAFETADALVETAAVIHVAGPHSIKLAWQTHYVGHLRAVNNNFLDTYQLKSQNAVLDGTVERIARRDDGGFRVDFRYARTVESIRASSTTTGSSSAPASGSTRPSSTTSARPRLVINDRFPEQTPAYESVNVPGLYFAGTLTQQRDFKKSTNGFIHGFRYGVRALHRILDARHHDTPWPATALDATPEAITDAIIARINRTSALWQQFAVLADVVTVAGDAARYHEEVPVAYLRDGGLGPEPSRSWSPWSTGPDHDQVDPFDITVPRIAENDAGRRARRQLPAPGRPRATAAGGSSPSTTSRRTWRTTGTCRPCTSSPSRVFIKGVLADAG